MLLVFTALTAVMTYPQVLHLRDGVHDDGDPLLNTWTLTWVAHQLPRAPALTLVSDANVNVEYAYGGGSEGSASAVIVLGVNDAQRAAAAAGI